MPERIFPMHNGTRPRLLALDLDGTLIGHDLRLSPRVRAAVAQAQALGVHVSLATGRGPSPTDQFAQQLGLRAPLICFQGGLVYDYVTGRTLHERRLDPAVVPVIVRLAREHGWNLQFETPRMIYLPRESKHPNELLALISVSNWTRVHDLAADLPETPHKFILSVHDPAERDALTEQLRNEAQRAGLSLTVVASHRILVEGLPAGLDKVTGLQWLAEDMGIAREAVMAVGDNDNDAPMLAWAGVGVAMGNASPAARQAADWIAPSVEHDGAAVAIEKYLL
jgi:Cof subfamily protein (haloacid dehalogenase superfamily)